MSDTELVNAPKPKRRALVGLLYIWGGFVKFSHTLFAMPFALASMMVASREHYRYHEANPGSNGNPLAPAFEFGFPGPKLFLLIIVCMVCARTCAMAFNRIVDRKFDAKNPRTANRHLPAGGTIWFSAWSRRVLMGAGFLLAAGFINTACCVLGPVALFFICFYSLTKRFTDYTHIWLGIALALAPVGACIAVEGGSMPELFQLLPLGQSLLPLLLLFAARIIDGISGGTAATASAVLADITPPDKRARAFGLIGVACSDSETDQGASGAARMEDQGQEHVSPGQPHDAYSSIPAISGPHFGQPLAPARWGVH